MAVAVESQTQPSYVTRYFGSRDRFLMAVADELSSRVASMDLGLGILAGLSSGNAGISPIFAVPEVESWFKLWRYLAVRDLSFAGSRMGDGPILTAGMRNLEENLGLDPRDARTWALLSLVTILGFRVFGDALGATDEDTSLAATTLASAPARRRPPRPRTPSTTPESGRSVRRLRHRAAGSTGTPESAEHDQVVPVDDLGRHVLGQFVGPQPGPTGQRRRPAWRTRPLANTAPSGPTISTASSTPKSPCHRHDAGRQERPTPLDQGPAGAVVDHDASRRPDGEGDPQLAGRQHRPRGDGTGCPRRASPRPPTPAPPAGRRRR